MNSIDSHNKCLHLMRKADEIADSCDPSFFSIFQNTRKVPFHRKDIPDEIFRIFDKIKDKAERPALIKAFETADLAHRQISISEKSYHNVYKPKLKSLAYLALHYREKYGVHIWFASKNTSLSFLIKKAEDQGLDSFGVVVSYHLTREGERIPAHVTPLVFLLNHETRKWEILANDSVENNRQEVKNYLFKSKTFEDEQIGQVIINSIVRQGDMHSCRIDAMVTLRNHLLQIKHSAPSTIDELVQETEKGYIDKNIRICRRLLPCDSYSSQKHSIDTIPPVEVVRDRFSKIEKKREHPKSNSDLWDQFVQALDLEQKYLFPSEKDNDQLKEFSFTRTSKRNLYLQYKGAHLFLKITQAPDIFPREMLLSIIFS